MTGNQTTAGRCTHGGDCPIHPDAQGLHNYSAEWDRGNILNGPWEVYVDTIRTAARLMRERAEAAAKGPWEADAETVSVAGENRHVCEAFGLADKWPNAQHIASWNPVVAVAVADWLDTGANQYACVDRAPMLRVARAYLGEVQS